MGLRRRSQRIKADRICSMALNRNRFRYQRHISNDNWQNQPYRQRRIQLLRFPRICFPGNSFPFPVFGCGKPFFIAPTHLSVQLRVVVAPSLACQCVVISFLKEPTKGEEMGRA